MKRPRQGSSQLNTLTTEQIETYSEFFKERIYATITLLALLTTLWQTSEHLSAFGAAISVSASVIALWLAIGISSRLAYQVLNKKRMTARVHGESLRSHAGLLLPAVPPLFMIVLSAIGLIPLSMALFISIILLLLSFAAFSYIAGRRIDNTGVEIVFTVGLELALGLGIVALKLIAGH